MATKTQAPKEATNRPPNDTEVALGQAIKEQVEAYRKMGGRPKSTIPFSRVALFKDVVDHAGYVASRRGISIHKYLSDILAPIVYGDFAHEMVVDPGKLAELYRIFSDASCEAAGHTPDPE
jgi:hypothetical protein